MADRLGWTRVWPVALLCAAALGALGGAIVFTGSVRSSVILLTAATATTVLVFVLRPFIAPGPIVHHAQELTRE